MHELIRDITLCILFAWVLGLLAHFSRQPLILAYLIAGFFIGPFGMGWVKSQESISIISELGLIFMLFMIGLEIDLKKIVRAGKVILFAAGGQLVGGCLLGVAVLRRHRAVDRRRRHFDALYLCVACALSSTVIIVKVLYEKRELDTLPGRITLGVLVLQDIFAILFLAVQPSLDNLQVSVILLSIGRVGVLVATALVLSRYVLPRLFHQIARRPELILLGALAWCFLIGEIAERLHLSREMGSLVAGVSLSTFPYALDVTAKVTTLRDFFITLFFVALGMTIPIPGLLGDRARADDRGVHGGQPRRDDVRPALSDEAGPARQPAAGDQSGADQRILAGGDPDRRRRGPYPTETASAASFAFVVLAVLSTFVMMRSDQITGWAIGPLKRIGLRDLDHDHATPRAARGRPRRGPADRHPRLFPRGQRAAEPRSSGRTGRCSTRSAWSTSIRTCSGRLRIARPARDLWRHQQCRHAAACRRRQGRDHHPERAGLAAEGRQQREAGPPRPHAQSRPPRSSRPPICCPT